MVIQSHVKLSYKNDFMIVRGDEVKMIHLSEIKKLSGYVREMEFLIRQTVKGMLQKYTII